MGVVYYAGGKDFLFFLAFVLRRFLGVLCEGEAIV